MVSFLNKFKALYANSLRVKSLVFAASASAVISGIYGWSLFQQDDFNIIYDNYQYFSKVEGRRASPSTYYVRSKSNDVLPLRYLALDCFHRFDLEREFYIGYVEYGDNNIVVACSQEDVRLLESDGLAAVSQRLKLEQLFAKSALLVLFISLGGLFSLTQIRALFGR